MPKFSDGPMAGKTVVVTGSTAGIGRATALGLAMMGARVAVTGRDAERTSDTAREIRAASGGQVDAFVADLSSQAQVRRLANELLERLPRIDVLVNNAGGYWSTRRVSAEGLEHTFALNHLAPFLLTNLLLDRLYNTASEFGAPARVVMVSSYVHNRGRIDFDDLQGEHTYTGARAYSQSKLANILFAYELARRFDATSVVANALHPGVVSTSLGVEDPSRTQRLLVPLVRTLMKSPTQGALTSIYLAAAPELDGVTGRYFVNSKPKRSSKLSHDELVASRLWQASAAMVGLTSTA